ncbi:catalase HPII [Citrobacter freundii]|nr:catalase HPII [Citrobacter freundii]
MIQPSAEAVADNLGFELTEEQAKIAPPAKVNGLKSAPSLSLYAGAQGEIKGRVVAILLNDQVKSGDLLAIMQALQAKGVHAKLLYSRMGNVVADDGSVLTIAGTFAGSPSLTVDAVIVPGGNIADIAMNGDARYYLLEAYKHLKPIALAGDARQFKATLNIKNEGEEGVVEADSADAQFMDTLLTLMTAHRVWSRAGKIDTIPA